MTDVSSVALVRRCGRPAPRFSVRVPVLTCAMALGAAALAACGNAKPQVSQAGQTTGVYADHIVLGGVASLTGPLPADFAPIFEGVQAYVDMVNAEGGVNGRKLDYPSNDQLDDASSPSQDADQVRNLVENDGVFAVVGIATPSFTGARFLDQRSVPAFGWAINPQWSPAPNLFGSDGSYVSFTAPETEVGYLAQQVHAHVAAVLAYNVAESQAGCQGVIGGLQKFGIDVAVKDLSIPGVAFDFTADVNHIRAAGATLVASCMDIRGNLALSQALHQAGLGGVTQYWLDGYDPATLAVPQNTPLMQNVYFLIQHAPFEAAGIAPNAYPGMVRFLAALARYEPGTEPSETALAGWLNADLFVTALRRLGRNVTRQGLIDEINSMRDYSAGGILAPVDWRYAHTADTNDCTAFVEVEGAAYVPRFGSSGSVFTCFAMNQGPVSRIMPITGIPGLPGVTAGRDGPR